MSTSEYNIVDVNPLYRENTIMINDNYDKLAAYYPSKDKGSTYYKLLTGLPPNKGINLYNAQERREKAETLDELVTKYNVTQATANMLMQKIQQLS